MREILFRGKELYGDRWLEGSLLIFPNTKRAKILKWNNSDLEFDEIEVIPKTVGQYTGFNDANGKKIFEGDVIKIGFSERLMDVRWNDESLSWELTDVNVSNCEVNHLINTFELGELGVEACYGEPTSAIIGNIHDNSELLNEV